MFNSQFLVDFMSNYKEFAVLISLAISVLIALSGVLPSVFVTGANVIVFGSITGFIISLMGEVIGATITFYLYRLGFKGKAKSLGNKYNFLKKLTKSRGIKAGILVMQGRLIPFVPSGFVTFSGAVSEIDAITFTLATLVGKIPSIALEVLVSHDVVNVKENFIRLMITIIALIIMFLTLRDRKTS